MSLRTRHTLPFLIAIVWLAATLLLPPGLSDFEQATWLAAFFFTMFVVDRIYVAYARRRYGVDPMKLHWSERRNRDGAFFCPACTSIFLLPPEDFSEAGMVHCGDCGHAIAPYGEMKPLVQAQGRHRLQWMARRLWR